MRILAINASHRGDRGFTQALVEQMKTGATEAGAEFDTVTLAQQKINRCLGCEVCHTNKSYLKCVYEDQDDMKAILMKIAASDIIVYATPVYVFSMSASMKNFLDRLNSTGDINQIRVSRNGLLFHHIDADICSKPFVLLTVCGNIENETIKNVVSYFKTFSMFMDAPMVGLLIRKSSFLLQNKTIGELPAKASVMQAFYDAGKELAIHARVSKKTQKRAARNVLDIPAVILLLMKIRPVKKWLVEAGRKRNMIHYK